MFFILFISKIVDGYTTFIFDHIVFGKLFIAYIFADCCPYVVKKFTEPPSLKF
jgi:hypothetical protein